MRERSTPSRLFVAGQIADVVSTSCSSSVRPWERSGAMQGHERRGSDLVPSRSAVLGLLGAALGIERADADGQAALGRYGVAARPLTRSDALSDYHTVQTVPAKIRHPGGRRAAIDAIGREINTKITVRDYRTDVAVAVAVWSRDGRWSLKRMAAALRRPTFVLFLGRKSCPLAAPVHPRIVEAPDPVAALRDCAAPGWLRRVAPRRSQERSVPRRQLRTV